MNYASAIDKMPAIGNKKKHLVEAVSECTQNVSQNDTLSIIHSHTHAKIYKDYTCIRTYNMYVP